MPKDYERGFGWFELNLIAAGAKPNTRPALDFEPYLAEDLLGELYTKAT